MTQEPKFFYGWVIVFLAFMSITTYGLFYSFSAFIEPLEAEFHCSRAAISAAYTIYLAVYSVCAVPMGLFCDRYGPQKVLWLAALFIGCGICLCSFATSLWHLYLFFGVIASIGHGAIFVVPTSTLNRWFIQRRGLAVGLAVCGLGVGLLVVPRFMAIPFISTYGWQTAFILLGVIFVVINGLVGVFMRRSPADKGLRPYGEIGEPASSASYSSGIVDFSIAEALKTRAFWMLYLVCVFCFGAEQMVLLHIVPYGGEVGISPAEATLGLSFLGIGTIIGRVSTGALSDRIGRVITLVISCGIEAAAIFLLIAVKSPLALYLTMLLLGFGYGGWVVLTTVMLADFFGLKNVGTIIGIWFTSGVPAAILGPLMGGIVFDFTKSYFLALMIAGVVGVLAAILAALVRRPKRIQAM